MPFEIHSDVIYTIVAGWFFSAVVHALPELKPDSPGWYVFVFRLLHGLFANISMLTKKPTNPPQE